MYHDLIIEALEEYQDILQTEADLLIETAITFQSIETDNDTGQLVHEVEYSEEYESVIGKIESIKKLLNLIYE